VLDASTGAVLVKEPGAGSAATWPPWWDSVADRAETRTCDPSLSSRRPVVMVGGRLSEPRTFEYGMIRLDPPPPSASPKVSAQLALQSADPFIQGGSRAQLVLALLSSTPGTQDVLAWVVVAQDVPGFPSGAGIAPGGTTVVTAAPCYLSVVITGVDATTGAHLDVHETGGGSGFTLPTIP
jgi:hypothetical protein